MSKRKITGAVGLRGRVYRAGEEEALFADAEGVDLSHALEGGALEGDWTHKAESLDEKNVDELKEIAKELEVVGYSTLNKDPLIKAIQEAGA